MTRAVLLGPLAPDTDLEAELRLLDVEGPIALVTAGWEEAERNDAGIDRHLGGGTRNLGLYGRYLDILETDSDYAEALRGHRAELSELQAAYRVRVRHALAAVETLQRRQTGARRSAGTYADEAMQAVRALDDAHAEALSAARFRFAAEHPVEDRDIVIAHREAVRAVLQDCEALAMAGGHVGVLSDCLHMCDIGVAAAGLPVLAWSSGCVSLAERVLVVDDDDIAGRPGEVVAEGLGICAGIAPVPDAARRLHAHNADALAMLARRCAPRVCVLLDAGDRVEYTAAGQLDLSGARVVMPDGAVRSDAAAA